MNKEFMVLNEYELAEVDGGSISLAAGIAIGCAGMLVVSAAASAYNGYQDAKRGV